MKTNAEIIDELSSLNTIIENDLKEAYNYVKKDDTHGAFGWLSRSVEIHKGKIQDLINQLK